MKIIAFNENNKKEVLKLFLYKKRLFWFKEKNNEAILIRNYYRHQGVPTAKISLTLSRHLSLTVTASDKLHRRYQVFELMNKHVRGS